MLIAIATGVGIAIFLALDKNHSQADGQRPPREILFGNEYEDETSKINLFIDANFL